MLYLIRGLSVLGRMILEFKARVVTKRKRFSRFVNCIQRDQQSQVSDQIASEKEMTYHQQFGTLVVNYAFGHNFLHILGHQAFLDQMVFSTIRGQYMGTRRRHRKSQNRRI